MMEMFSKSPEMYQLGDSRDHWVQRRITNGKTVCEHILMKFNYTKNKVLKQLEEKIIL